MITSRTNQKVKELIKLRDKRSLRTNTGLFLVEGPRMCFETPRECLHEVFVSTSYAAKQGAELQDLRMPYEVLSDEVFAMVSDTKTPQGIMAVVKMQTFQLDQLWTSERPLLLVLETIQDPGNLGTIFRSAEAAGVTGIIMSSDCVDLYNPKTIRSTMGSLYRMPFVVRDDLAAVVHMLQDQGIKTFATSLEATISYDACSFAKGCAFLIGNEGNGLSDVLVKAADQAIHIPMQGAVESLNAAVATSVLLFEAARQRTLS